MKLTGKWTAEERIAIAKALLSDIQLDIPAGRYSEVGRPNITSVIGILCWPAEQLVPYTEEAQRIWDKFDKQQTGDVIDTANN